MASGPVIEAWAAAFCLGCDQPASEYAYCSEQCRFMELYASSPQSTATLSESNQYRHKSPEQSYISHFGINDQMSLECFDSLHSKLFEPRSLGTEGDYQSLLSISRSEIGGKQALEATVAVHHFEYHLRTRVQWSRQHRSTSRALIRSCDRELLKSPTSGGIGWDTWRPREASHADFFQDVKDGIWPSD